MQSKLLTNKQIEAAFERFVKNPIEAVPTDSGFDSKTEAALYQVAMDPSPITIASARKVLAMQLNGSHQRENDAKIEAMLKRGMSRTKRP